MVTLLPWLLAWAAAVNALPFVEDFNSSAQMTLSHNFGTGRTYQDYFGIADGDNSDFGNGSFTPLQYQGKNTLWALPCKANSPTFEQACMEAILSCRT